ncbi:endonuclease/exonuclease/phosphatase family protein [Myxococcota bacterium]|nr:endonuclease/exonuclease/phosphatase family protein [Myxococcota bacterium]MBU1379758.1 endonuclease/exonuclease/phosphatase family protein [Myxococcota bacterium]MBU1498529.1 endonuclease/exonuclease/phosphatase family protein [Myxococcota bacterium]
MKKSYKFMTFITAVFSLILLLPQGASAKIKHGKVKAMSRNLYLGADIFKVVEAAMDTTNPYAVPAAVATVFQTVQYTNFPERAQALADEVLENNPDVIGLQEVTEYFMQAPGDFLYGNPITADMVVIDFLQVFLAALEERGMNYSVASVSYNADIELPMFAGFTPEGYPILNDLRMLDRDVILVKNNVHVTSESNGNYYYNVAMDLGGVNVEFTRGWTSINAVIRNQEYRIVNTHLEVGGDPTSPFAMIQAAQMQELMGLLASETKNTILIGDFNSSPENVQTQPYHQAIAAGFVDSWTMTHYWNPGYTCCFNETVNDPDSELYERIDHIFFRFGPRALPFALTWRTGIDDIDMTPNGLWPSDHAGMYALISFLSW